VAKAVVTGGAGFIGAHLVARLLRDGTDVVVIDNLKRAVRSRLDGMADSRRLCLVEEDIRHFDVVADVVRGADVLYHLAAQSNVMGAVDDPDYSITTNVLGTFNVLRASAQAGVRRLVFTSSREVYGDPSDLPVDEDQPLRAKNPYGASKVAGEAYCRAFAGNRFSIEIVRLANVYGSGDSGRVIPLWLEAALSGNDLTVYGGEQVIDFLWVGTAVEALLHAAARGLPGPINIGSGVGTRIMDLAARVLGATGSKSRIVRTAAREIEVPRFVADVTRMRSLGIQPESDPLGHLREIVAAYSAPPA
jgi:UDP-glucose 4-epimerase